MRFIFILGMVISTICFGQDFDAAGINSDRLKRLDRAMQKYIDKNMLVGISTYVMRQGIVIHNKHFGSMDPERQNLIASNTIFRIYSMTKCITSVAIMMLYEEGHFALYDPVSKFIPEFKHMKVYVGENKHGHILEKMKREPTIRDLLLHTSGLAYGFGNSAVDKIYAKAKLLDKQRTLKQMVTKLTKLPLKYHPGTKWEYSISTDVLAHIVEIISGKNYDEFLQKRLFNPLEMTDTDFYVPREKQHRFMPMYIKSEGYMHTINPASFFHKPPFLSGGGGLVSTLKDYSHFCTMLLNNGNYKGIQILSRKTVDFMRQNHLSHNLLPYGTRFPLHGYGFGLGFSVVMDTPQSRIIGSKGMYGWAGIANTYFFIDPKEKIIAMVFTQFKPFGYGNLYNDFRTTLYQALK